MQVKPMSGQLGSVTYFWIVREAVPELLRIPLLLLLLSRFSRVRLCATP